MRLSEASHAICAVTLIAAAASAQAAGVKGERVPDWAIGEGYIETMEQMAARDRANPAPPAMPDRGRIGWKGTWVIPTERNTGYPHSGWHYAVNKAGDMSMGIGFAAVVSVDSVWIAGQGQPNSWAAAVRVVGYNHGVEVARTERFELTSDRMSRLVIGFDAVDRIVFEAEASEVIDFAGWYAIDDLAYTMPGDTEPTVVDFEDTHHKDKLTGTTYAGLTWEMGTSPDPGVRSLPAPQEPPARDRVPAEGDEIPANLPLPDATLPDLLDDWQSVKRGDLSQWSFPPDTCGAVGPNHFCTIVNSNFVVYDKNTHAIQYNVSLSSFQPGTSGDPRVLYDQHSGRWIAVSTNFNKHIYLNISLTDDPSGAWYKTNWQAATGSDAACWIDYPTLGVNEEGIFVCCGMFNACGLTIFAIDKAPLVDDSPNLETITAWRGNSLYELCIHGAHQYGEAGEEYLISLHPTYSNRLRMRKIDGPMTSPTLSGPYNVSIPTYTPKYTAPALGSTTEIETVSPRLMNAVYRDGYVWTTHTVSTGRAACRWYKINVNSYSAQNGTVWDGTTHYYMPSITVNSIGAVVMGFSGSHDQQYVGGYYTGRLPSDPSGEMADPFQYRTGQGAYNLLDQSSRNRWGDYSLCTLDPDDELTMWTIQEFVYSTSRWGTWIAKLGWELGPDNDNCFDAPIVFDGSHAFTNIEATTDGPTEDGECDNLLADVWFRYGASCDGEATVDLSDSDYDTVVGIYGSNCPTGPGEIIACNDDFGGPQSKVSFPVQSGTIYIIRIGGAGGEQGSGTMEISCGPGNPCPEDVNGDDTVDIDDLFDVLAHWGEAGGQYDANDDGIVDIDDVFAILAAWGPCP